MSSPVCVDPGDQQHLMRAPAPRAPQHPGAPAASARWLWLVMEQGTRHRGPHPAHRGAMAPAVTGSRGSAEGFSVGKCPSVGQKSLSGFGGSGEDKGLICACQRTGDLSCPWLTSVWREGGQEQSAGQSHNQQGLSQQTKEQDQFRIAPDWAVACRCNPARTTSA